MALPLGLIKMSLAIQPKHQLVSGGTAAVCNMFVRAGECSRAFLLVKLVNAHDLGLHHAIHKIQSGKPDLQPFFSPFVQWAAATVIQSVWRGHTLRHALAHALEAELSRPGNDYYMRSGWA